MTALLLTLCASPALPSIALPPVSVEAGELPIVISAPHGGRQRIKGVPDRTGSPAAEGKPKYSGFQTALDAGTDALARAVADEIARSLGKRPYLVVSNTTRKQFDANRPEVIAVESEGARPAYLAYHEALTRFRGEILSRFGAGLLIDLHGQGSTKDAIYRGTANGTTVAGLPRAALVGPQGLLGLMEARGVRFIPTCAEEGKRENPALDGGWIVRHYGALREDAEGRRFATPERFWAVQMETGADFRTKAAIPTTATILGEAVVAFARANLGVR